MLNTEYQFIIYIDHKPLVRFLHAEYYEDIFTYWANKLYLLNIHIQHISEENNIVVDSLSRIIFYYANYSLDQLVYKFSKDVILYQDDKE